MSAEGLPAKADSGEAAHGRRASGRSVPARVGRSFLLLTVFATGAVVMTVEIIGTRVIGPVFGVGLFVWSALLAVTLASLACGYYAGGVVADRKSHPWALGIVLAASGLLIAAVPYISHDVLQASTQVGPRGGPLLSASLLFAPTLMALGMTGPISVSLAALTSEGLGRGVGTVYAVSTAGSLLATLVVGFLLIPVVEASTVLLVCACLLLVLAAGWLARGRLVALGLSLVLLLLGHDRHATLPPGIVVEARGQSLLGLVEVIRDDNRGVRFLRSDHSLLGAQFVVDGSSAFGFVSVLEASRFFHPHAQTALAIGLGTGAAPHALGKHGLRVDVVEIDPIVVRFAQAHFGFAATGEVHVEDARSFLRSTTRRYDLVIHDSFTGGTTPEHLLSLEVLRRVAELLGPQGVLVLNFVGFYDGSGAEATFAVARTIRAVFPHVRAFRDRAPDSAKPVGNIVFFASRSPLSFRIPEGTRFENFVSEQLQRSFIAWETLENVPKGDLITDAKNPLARLQLPVAEHHFAAMNELLPVEVWLN